MRGGVYFGIYNEIFIEVKNLKKSVKIVLIIALGILLALVGYYSVLVFTHTQILIGAETTAEYYDDFLAEKDGYVLKSSVIERDNIDYIAFTIEKDGEVLFDCQKENRTWRANDFKELKFSDTSLDIIVESGDMGILVFEYDGKSWGLQV